MLPKNYRFPLATEFEEIKKEGKLTNYMFLGVLAKKHQDQLFSRFGFVVSLKIDKRSVVRHRLKRLLAEAVRHNLRRIKPGFDVVFLTKKNLIGKDLGQVEGAVREALGKAGLVE
jgi:ribonuclease P protein component